MIRRDIILDGSYNGIIAKAMNSGKYIIDKTTKRARLFSNFEVADLVLNSCVKNSDIRYSFSIDGMIIPVDNCTKIGEYYQYIDNSNQNIYYIKEVKEARLLKVGYLVFDNGDIERIDKSKGSYRNRTLIKYLKNLSVSIMSAHDSELGLTGVKEISNREYVLHLKHSTGRLHFIACSNIMDLNQARKEVGKKALVFNKDVDKYTCIYVYMTKLVGEPNKFETSERLNKLLDWVVDNLVENPPENSTATPKYIDVEFRYNLDDIEEV